MACNSLDFFVIYNRALSNKAETDDTRLSSEFTEYLVNKLEDGGTRVGYWHDRDAIPGKNVFKVLKENVTYSNKTIVVVTSEFIRNCWQTYSHQTAFKNLIDSDQTEKLIPIALCIGEDEKLDELNISEWIHFEDDYAEQTAKNEQKWNLMQKAVDCKESWTKITVSNEGIPECGDNRLRTDRSYLVTQPIEFFSDGLVMDIAEKFASDWKILCIKLGLQDHRVDEIERNHQNNSRFQAFKGLKGSLNSLGSNEKKKFDSLIEVLWNMHRGDIVEDVEKKYQEYQERNSQSNSCQSGTVQVVSEEQHNAQDDGIDIPDSSRETNFMSRELKPLQTAVINPVQQSADLSPKSESVSMDAGPCISLPSAPIAKLPLGPSVKLPSSQTQGKVTSSAVSKDGRQLYNAAHGDMKNQTSPSVVNSETSSVHIGKSGQYSKNISNKRNISSSNQTSPQLKPMEPVRHKDSGDANNGQRRDTYDTALKTPFQNQCSLSNDDDITADDGEASSIQQNGDQFTKSSAGNSDSLDRTEMLNLKSLDNDPVSTDSGLSSFDNTPILENVPCSGNQTEPVLNRIAPAMNQTVMSTLPTSSSLPVDRNKETGNQYMAVPDKLESSSANNSNTSLTDRNAGNSSLVSNVCSMVFNLMTRPEYAFN